MRGPVLLLAALVALPALSGCILTERDDDPAPLAPLLEWVLPATPDGRPSTGVYGVWIDDNATTLRVRWPAPTGDDAFNTSAGGGDDGGDRGGDGDDDPRDDDARSTARDDVHQSGARNILASLPDLIVIIAPDGTWRYLGTGTTRIPFGTANETGAPRIPGVLLIQDDPAPGLYRIVLQGGQTPPLVEVETATDLLVPPLAPLPVTVDRTILFEPRDDTQGLLGQSGTHQTPPHTVLAWADLRGAGFAGRIRLANAHDEPVSDHRHTVLAEPTVLNAGGTTFGLSRVADRSSYHPEALYERALSWSTDGTGSAAAYLYTTTAAAMPPPWPGGTDTAPPDAEEVVPLEGVLAPADAGGLTLPAEARLDLKLRESSSEARDHASYRIYSPDGRRLHWGTIDATGALLDLPTGPLAIINDGPGEIEVGIRGAAPTDAVLHPIEGSVATWEVSLGMPNGGQDEATQRAVFAGPVLRIAMYGEGTAEDVHVTVERADGAPVTSMPDLAAYPPGSWTMALVDTYVEIPGDARWLDPGVHTLRAQTAGGQGALHIEAITLDLSDLYALGQDDK